MDELLLYQSSHHLTPAPYYDVVAIQRVIGAKYTKKYNLQSTNMKTVINPHLLEKFQKRKCDLQQENGFVEEILLIHVTAAMNVPSIVTNNFDSSRVKRTKFGMGTSFTNDPTYGNEHANKQIGINRAFIICNVLISKVEEFRQRHPSPGFDTTISKCGKVLVKYNIDEVLPQYVVYYEHNPGVKGFQQSGARDLSDLLPGFKLMESPFNDVNLGTLLTVTQKYLTQEARQYQPVSRGTNPVKRVGTPESKQFKTAFSDFYSETRDLTQEARQYQPVYNCTYPVKRVGTPESRQLESAFGDFYSETRDLTQESRQYHPVCSGTYPVKLVDIPVQESRQFRPVSNCVHCETQVVKPADCRQYRPNPQSTDPNIKFWLIIGIIAFSLYILLTGMEETR